VAADPGGIQPPAISRVFPMLLILAAAARAVGYFSV